MARTKAKATFYPTRDSELQEYYKKVVNALVTLATKYGISAATIAALQAHVTAIQSTYTQALVDADKAENSTTIKNKEFAQAKMDLMRVLLQIQRAANFDEEDADLMGIRVITAPIDLDTVKPVISAITIKYGKVIIDWIKGQMEGVIVYGSYDGKKFAEIGRDTRSPFEDVRPNRVEDQPEERYYRLAYMKDDKPIGIPSAISKTVVDTAVV